MVRCICAIPVYLYVERVEQLSRFITENYAGSYVSIDSITHALLIDIWETTEPVEMESCVFTNQIDDHFAISELLEEMRESLMMALKVAIMETALHVLKDAEFIDNFILRMQTNTLVLRYFKHDSPQVYLQSASPRCVGRTHNRLGRRVNRH